MLSVYLKKILALSFSLWLYYEAFEFMLLIKSIKTYRIKHSTLQTILGESVIIILRVDII